MDRFIYTALTGMNAAMDRQRAVANNLANASTPGFRGEVFAVKSAVLESDPRTHSIDARAPARGSVRGADMGAGKVMPTGRALDVAVMGEGLIAFQDPSGTGAGGEVYSRRGDLRVSAAGVIENGDGLVVLGQGGGPLAVPPGFDISLAEDGTVFARDPAAPQAPPEAVGQIKLVSPEGSRIAKGLDGFLRVVGGGVLPPDPTERITRGTLEQSNVVTAQTLVEMVDAQRAFEQRARIIRTASELDEAGARLMSLK
ncbi:MAG: flagellar basal body rod protein FlgF [Erythrobacter sp.]|jgi:flagellar basal-body rod protein FlgF|nr:flagellar basal body rod protein FlgF [Erythrobacter sp.]